MLLLTLPAAPTKAVVLLVGRGTDEGAEPAGAPWGWTGELAPVAAAGAGAGVPAARAVAEAPLEM